MFFNYGMVKDQYSSSVRTKKNIRESCLLMLLNKKNDELEVKELCKVAGISRTTFYNHYQSLDGLFIDCLENKLSRLSNELKNKNYDEDDYLDSLLFDLSVFFKSDQEQISSLVSVTGSYSYEYIKNIVNDNLMKWLNLYHDDLLENNDFRMYISLCSHSIAGLYFDYFKKELDCSLLDIVSVSKNLYKPLLKVKKPRQKKSLF